MNTTMRDRNEDRFIVKIWKEGTNVQWRASVTHIETSQCRYFTNYGDLCEFLNRWAQVSVRERG